MMLLSLTLVSLATVALSVEVLVVTPSPSAALSSHFLGEYGTAAERYSVYRCPEDAVEFAAVSLAEDARIVYLQEAAVEPSVRGAEPTFAAQLAQFVHRARAHALSGSAPQTVLSESATAPAAVLHTTRTSALVAVPPSLLPQLDTLLPRLLVPVVLPTRLAVPVPPDAIAPLARTLATLRFNPDVAAITNHISVPQMHNDIRFLTGEDGVSGIVSRHSFAAGARTAAAWIAARIEATGAECALRPFLTGFAPNVVCRYPAPNPNTTATVILAAHYDARGTFGSVRAPGGDDDGSGVLSLLAIARATAATRLAFRAHVELVAFAGEEQGLLGSRAYAEELRKAGTNVTLMVQADMLAFRAPDEPPQLGQPDLIGTPEAAQLVANVSALYSPELTVGFTPACCSDHQTFHEAGFPATWVFERAGPIVDPMYHNSGDVSERAGYDLEQVRSIAKVMFATLLHMAGYDVRE